ncbi:YqhR family membrane protein [Litchfieldia salsa]|uniref:YqhR family membrane protein n=1 Tax=Litchfieldia salsa TaxID=930152 RepID=UPI000B879B66|nr:YqhR family membrane protein [Litchfieldia salsa]
MEVLVVEKEAKQNPQLEQNKSDEPMSMIAKVVITGLFGGIFWSLLNYGTYVFNFTEISPNLVLQPWTVGDWKDRVLGQFIGIAVIGILSIGVALLYYALLRRFQKIWVGMAFGIALWAMVFFVLNPIFPGLKAVTELDRNTNITTICFYILYGVFIGYSISFEANEFAHEKKASLVNE